MPTKTKTSKTRTRTKKLPAGQKNLSKEQKKKVKGGLLPGTSSTIGRSGITITTPISRYTVSSPTVGPASQLLNSELSATR